jgi:hypothetical protein
MPETIQPRTWNVVDILDTFFVHLTFALTLAVLGSWSDQSEVLWKCARVLALAAVVNVGFTVPVTKIILGNLIQVVIARRGPSDRDGQGQD